MSETLADRSKRIVKETGLRGLFLRMLVRGLRVSGTTLTGLADRMLCYPRAAFFTSRNIAHPLRENARLENRHEGERCFILATGPSLKAMDLSGLEDETVFAINQGLYFLKEKGLKADYYAVIDDMFLQSSFDGLHGEIMQYVRETGASLLTSVELAEHINRLGHEGSVHPVRQMLISTYWDQANMPVSIDMTQPVPGYVSVVHLAISCALYMGFREIHLLGCDMDYFVNPDATYQRCYDNQTYLAHDRNATELFAMDQVDLMEWVLTEFRAFRHLGRIAKARGAVIYNSGVGGALNVFPRRDLKEVLSQ